MRCRICLCTAAAVLLICGAANATALRHSAGPVQQVLVVSDAQQRFIPGDCSAGFFDIPDAWVKITIPPGANQLLVTRFAGNVRVSTSDQGTAGADLRIVIGTRELNPIAVNQVADTRDPYQPPIAIERSKIVAPGTYGVKAQVCTSNDNTARVNMLGWHMSVEAAPVQ